MLYKIKSVIQKLTIILNNLKC